MKRFDWNGNPFGVGIAIVAVALVIVIAALIETRPAADRAAAADAAASARAVAVATAGPAAGRAPVIPPGSAKLANVGDDVSVRCGAAAGPVGENGDADVNPLSSDEAPTVNVTDGGRMNSADHYKLAGWALAPHGASLLAGLCLAVDGKIDPRSRVLYGFARPDVAASYKHGDLTACGFEIRIAPHQVPLGRHYLEVIALTPDGVQHRLTGARTVTVY